MTLCLLLLTCPKASFFFFFGEFLGNTIPVHVLWYAVVHMLTSMSTFFLCPSIFYIIVKIYKIHI